LSRRARWLLISALGVVVAARAALPVAIQRYVNRVLDRNAAYTGSIGDVDVALFRGAYGIEDVDIRKRDGSVPVPFFTSEWVDLSIQWRALIDGVLVGEVSFLRPQINIVGGPRPQTGAGVDWRQTVEDLFPFEINHVQVRDGSLHYRDFHSDPRVDVYLHHLDLLAQNLTNSRNLAEDRVAQVTLRAIPMNAGLLRVRISLDPFEQRPDFDLDAELSGADLTQWNDFLRAYFHFDVERGGFDCYAELLASNDRFDGYVKPFFENVDVLRYEEERDEQGFFASLWEGIVGVAAEIFQDQPHDRVATRVPISGSVEDPQLGFWTTLGNVVRNAFIESLVPRLERSVGER
jgi:hypothetical protein